MSEKRFRFSLLTLFNCVLLCGFACYAVVIVIRANQPMDYGVPIDRSWMSGSISLQLKPASAETTFVIQGKYPDVAPNQFLQYVLWLDCEGADPVFMAGGTIPMTQKIDRSNLWYNHSSNNHPELIGVPVHGILDFEIWQDEPGRGKLLSKSSVLSKTHVLTLNTKKAVESSQQ